MPTIQNSAYARVTAAGTYNVVPTNNFGALLPQVTIDVDATLGDITVELPEIASTFAGLYGTKIIVNRVDASKNAVRVIVDSVVGNDRIGSATQVGLASSQDSITLQPVSNLGWSGSVTTSGLPKIEAAVAKDYFATAAFIDYPIGTVIVTPDYAGSGKGMTVVKMTTTGGNETDWTITATEDAVTTNHIGQSPK